MSITDRPVEVEASTVRAPSTARSRWALIARVRRDPAALAGAVLLGLILLALISAPLLASTDPTAVDVRNPLAPPSWDHPFGTDGLGRDLFSRILHGGRTSVAAAAVATVGIALLGISFGVVSGVRGGAVDSAIMRVVEILQALPLLIVAMVAIGLMGGGIYKLVLVIVLLAWPANARVVRAATLSLRETVFVDAARAQGSSRSRIMLKHVVPGVTSLVAALGLAELGRMLLVFSTLSFLGFGVRPPNPEWGAMLADARSAFFVAPKLLFIPGAAISLVVFAANLVGDAIRDALDQRSRGR